MKRLVLFVVALVFAFCTTVMAVDKPAAPPVKDEAVKAEKADVAKGEVKKAEKKAKKKLKKAAKKAAKKVKEEVPVVPPEAPVAK